MYLVLLEFPITQLRCARWSSIDNDLREPTEIVYLIRCPTVVGVPHQMSFWMLKVDICDDQSVEILKRDQAVSIFASLIEAKSSWCDGRTHLLVPCGRPNILQLEGCRALRYGCLVPEVRSRRRL